MTQNRVGQVAKMSQVIIYYLQLVTSHIFHTPVDIRCTVKKNTTLQAMLQQIQGAKKKIDT